MTRPSCRPLTDIPAGMVTVPGSNGNIIAAAVEDTRRAIIEGYFAVAVVESADLLSDTIKDIATTLRNYEDVGHDAVEATNEDVPRHGDERTADDDGSHYALVTASRFTGH